MENALLRNSRKYSTKPLPLMISHHFKWAVTFVISLIVLSYSLHADARSQIKQTRHNLSSSGLYDIKAAGTSPKDTEICFFCHAPHNAESAEVPLWNRRETEAIFQMASSANVVHGGTNKRSWADGYPSGVSKKCLSCHDGTVAIGAVVNLGGATVEAVGEEDMEIVKMTSSADSLNPDGTLKEGSRGYIGTDLRSGHVISFTYKPVADLNEELVPWDVLDEEDRSSMFDKNGKVQCHSCHDPHNDFCNDPDETVGRDPLWRKECGTVNGKENSNATVCITCHLTTFGGYTQAFPF